MVFGKIGGILLHTTGGTITLLGGKTLVLLLVEPDSRAQPYQVHQEDSFWDIYIFIFLFLK